MLRAGAFILILLPLLVVNCTRENPEFQAFDDGAAAATDGQPGAEGQPVPDGPTHFDGVGQCTPHAFIGCKSATVVVRCNASGVGSTTGNCAYGCNPKTRRCNQCSPGLAPKCVGQLLYVCTPDGIIHSSKCSGECKDGKCQQCKPQTFYRDQDQDGHGDPKHPVSACAQPAGHVTDDEDCDDNDPAVHPKQKSYFPKPAKGGGFDYDCDGKQEQRHDEMAHCKREKGKCEGHGWGLFVPACGGTGVWVTCKPRPYSSKCDEQLGGRVQTCR